MFFRLRDAGFGRRRLPRSTGAVNASRFFSFRLPCPNLILSCLILSCLIPPCLILPRLILVPFVNIPAAAAPIIALPGMTLVGPIALVFNHGFDRGMGISMRR
jgi:hypothetical protein